MCWRPARQPPYCVAAVALRLGLEADWPLLPLPPHICRQDGTGERCDPAMSLASCLPRHIHHHYLLPAAAALSGAAATASAWPRCPPPPSGVLSPPEWIEAPAGASGSCAPTRTAQNGRRRGHHRLGVASQGERRMPWEDSAPAWPTYSPSHCRHPAPGLPVVGSAECHVPLLR